VQSCLENSTLESLTKTTNRLQGRRDQLREDYKRDKVKLKELKKKDKVLDEALTLTQIVAQKTQEELEYRISDIVTAALASVFPEPYRFKIKFEIKRGKTEARMFFTRDGEEIDPLTASGGGVVDVAAFALRLSCYLLNPHQNRVMVLDEPFRFPSVDLRPKVADLITELSEKLEIQFIIVTHEDEYKIGNVIEWE